MDKVKVGIVSFAHLHGWVYLDCLMNNPQVEIAGFYDDDAQRTAEAERKTGIPGCASLEQLLSLPHDMVVVTSENACHEQYVIAAANKKIPVICEKPLGVTRESMENMIAACCRNKVPLMTAFPNRFSCTVLKAKAELEAGRIGKLVAVKATNKGKMPGGWFVEPSLSGGGSLVDHTVHVADLINWMTGQRATSVFAYSNTKLHPALTVDDVSVVHFCYEDGLFVTLDSSWSRCEHYPSDRNLTMEMIGTEGVMSVDVVTQYNAVLTDDCDRSRWRYYNENKNQLMIDDAICRVQNKEEFSVTGRDGYHAALVMLAAMESAKVNSPVSIDANTWQI